MQKQDVNNLKTGLKQEGPRETGWKQEAKQFRLKPSDMFDDSREVVR